MANKLRVRVKPFILLLKALDKLEDNDFDLDHYIRKGYKDRDFDPYEEAEELLLIYNQFDVSDFAVPKRQPLLSASSEHMHQFLINRYNGSKRFDSDMSDQWQKWSIKALGFEMFNGKSRGKNFTTLWRYIFCDKWPPDPKLTTHRILCLLSKSKDLKNYGYKTKFCLHTWLFNRLLDSKRTIVDLDFVGVTDKDRKFLDRKLKNK